MKRTLARVALRWLDWDGQCGHPVEFWIGGFQAHCSGPVGRYRYAFAGRCWRCRRPRPDSTLSGDHANGGGGQ